MTFTTLTFILFLAFVFALYWCIRVRKLQNLVLALASYFFYGWWDWRYCLLMLGASLVDFFVGLALDRIRQTAHRRALLLVSLGCQVGLLGFFKYFNFFAENLQILADSLGWHMDAITLRIVLPIGISFYTFQTMSYVILIYQRKMTSTTQLIDYLAYVSFFPQLVAGPIEKANQLLPQFLKSRQFDYADAVDGCRQMLWGFFKKMVLADNLAPVVDRYYGNLEGRTGLEMAFATSCFAFQIYCDFSAYSDIALGTGKLFGIRLMRNFAYPYFSQSIGEFWRRWHISLSTWFRDYVYIPLGGSRGGLVSKICNVLVTFLVSGLWHGASWNFVIWGGVHGVGSLPTILGRSSKRLSATDTPGGERLVPGPLTLLSMAATFTIVCLAWVFFRARTFYDAWAIWQLIADPAFLFWPYREFCSAVLQEEEIRSTLGFLAAFLVVEWIQRRHPHPLVLNRWPRWLRWVVYTGLIWTTLYFGTRNQGQFIYFQF